MGMCGGCDAPLPQSYALHAEVSSRSEATCEVLVQNSKNG